jgi:tetratricopeptide (TPR) repeat protein
VTRDSNPNLESKPEPVTQIDLGDDLLNEHSKVGLQENHSDEDLLENARILQSEGLIDEAKRSLRKLLISDPRNAAARQALQAIQDQELRGLLDGSQIERMRLTPAERAEGDEVIKALDRDFALGIMSETERETRQSDEGIDRVLSDMETALAGCEGRDRIDVGIAFLEMGSPRVAEHHFRAAREYFQRLTSEPSTQEYQDYKDENGDKAEALENQIGIHRRLVASIALLAHSQLSAGRSLEALHTLQEALKSLSRGTQVEVELLYLMGRASEAVGRREEALVWYGKALEAEPGYRDTASRLAGGK